jgi:two-component sensor histidine kinase
MRWLMPMALAWALAALVATQTYLSMHDHGHAWWRLLVWQGVGWSVFALAAPWLLRAGGAWDGGWERWRYRWLVAHVVASAATGVAQAAAAAAAGSLLQPFAPVSSWSFAQYFRQQLSLVWVVGLLVYWGLVGAGYGLGSRERQRRLALRESRLETELARAQLEALRLELQPHFLFNTLNSIAALVRKRDNPAALEMLLSLSHLLRMTLDRSRRQLTPLAEELELVERYVALQRVRFGDRLQVEYAIDERGRDALVPAMLLQPLVENAIRHGIEPRAKGGVVRVTCTVRAPRGGGAQRLVLAVGDDGVGAPAEVLAGEAFGVGLSNTRSRLEQLYGEGATLCIRLGAAGGTEVVVEMPLQGEHETVVGSAPRPSVVA